MRIAVIYREQDVFVEFSVDKFKALLKQYMGISERSKTWSKIDKAFEKIAKDLKKETIKC